MSTVCPEVAKDLHAGGDHDDEACLASLVSAAARKLLCRTTKQERAAKAREALRLARWELFEAIDVDESFVVDLGEIDAFLADFAGNQLNSNGGGRRPLNKRERAALPLFAAVRVDLRDRVVASGGKGEEDDGGTSLKYEEFAALLDGWRRQHGGGEGGTDIALEYAAFARRRRYPRLLSGLCGKTAGTVRRGKLKGDLAFATRKVQGGAKRKDKFGALLSIYGELTGFFDLFSDLLLLQAVWAGGNACERAHADWRACSAAGAPRLAPRGGVGGSGAAAAAQAYTCAEALAAGDCADSRAFTLLMVVLACSVLAPYLVAFSSGVHFLLGRGIFDAAQLAQLPLWRRALTALYATPLGPLYFLFIDLCMLGQAATWDLYALTLGHDAFMRGQSRVDAFYDALGMDHMAVEGYRRQRTIAQLLFESVPQVLVQALIFLGVMRVGDLMETAQTAIIMSVVLSAVNVVSQFGKIYVEARGLRISFVRYAMTCMLARLGFVPFLDELVGDAEGVAARVERAAVRAAKAEVGGGEEDVEGAEVEVGAEEAVAAAASWAALQHEKVVDMSHIQCPVPLITDWTGFRMDVDFEFSRNSVAQVADRFALVPEAPRLAKLRRVLLGDACRSCDVFEVLQLVRAAHRKIDLNFERVDWQAAVDNARIAKRLTVPPLGSADEAAGRWNARTTDGTPLLRLCLMTEEVLTAEQRKANKAAEDEDADALPPHVASFYLRGVARALLTCGIARDSVDQARGETLLIFCARTGRNGGVALLLEHGAGADFCAQRSRSPTVNGGWETKEQTPLCTAIRVGNLKAVQLLLGGAPNQRPGDPNWPGIGGALGNDGDSGTPVMHALRALAATQEADGDVMEAHAALTAVLDAGGKLGAEESGAACEAALALVMVGSAQAGTLPDVRRCGPAALADWRQRSDANGEHGHHGEDGEQGHHDHHGHQGHNAEHHRHKVKKAPKETAGLSWAHHSKKDGKHSYSLAQMAARVTCGFRVCSPDYWDIFRDGLFFRFDGGGEEARACLRGALHDALANLASCEPGDCEAAVDKGRDCFLSFLLNADAENPGVHSERADAAMQDLALLEDVTELEMAHRKEHADGERAAVELHEMAHRKETKMRTENALLRLARNGSMRAMSAAKVLVAKFDAMLNGANCDSVRASYSRGLDEDILGSVAHSAFKQAAEAADTKAFAQLAKLDVLREACPDLEALRATLKQKRERAAQANAEIAVSVQKQKHKTDESEAQSAGDAIPSGASGGSKAGAEVRGAAEAGRSSPDSSALAMRKAFNAVSRSALVANADERVKLVVELLTLGLELVAAADLYTDTVILLKMYRHDHMAWATATVVMMVSPYLVCYAALISLLLRSRVFEPETLAGEPKRHLGLRKTVGLLYLSPLCICYFVLVDVIYTFKAVTVDLTSMLLRLLTFGYVQPNRSGDSAANRFVNNVLGLSKMDVEGYRRLRTLSQLIFESFPQIALQARIILAPHFAREIGLTDGELFSSMGFAIFHLLVTGWVLRAEAFACKDSGLHYLITCLSGRFGWVPFAEKFRHGAAAATGGATVAKKKKGAAVVPAQCATSDDAAVAPPATYAYGSMSTKLAVGGKFKMDYEFSPATVDKLVESLSHLDVEPDAARRLTVELGDTVSLCALKDLLKMHVGLDGKVNLVMGAVNWRALLLNSKLAWVGGGGGGGGGGGDEVKLEPLGEEANRLLGRFLEYENEDAVCSLLEAGVQPAGVTAATAGGRGKGGVLFLTAAVHKRSPRLCELMLDSLCALAPDAAAKGANKIKADFNGVFKASLKLPLAEAVRLHDLGVLEVFSTHPRVRICADDRKQLLAQALGAFEAADAVGSFRQDQANARREQLRRAQRLLFCAGGRFASDSPDCVAMAAAAAEPTDDFGGTAPDEPGAAAAAGGAAMNLRAMAVDRQTRACLGWLAETAAECAPALRVKFGDGSSATVACADLERFMLLRDKLSIAGQRFPIGHPANMRGSGSDGSRRENSLFLRDDGGEATVCFDHEQMSQIEREPLLHLLELASTTPALCPKRGHLMRCFRTPQDGYGCDGCGASSLPAGTMMSGCRLCNTDLCRDCAGRATALGSSVRRELLPSMDRLAAGLGLDRGMGTYIAATAGLRAVGRLTALQQGQTDMRASDPERAKCVMRVTLPGDCWRVKRLSIAGLWEDQGWGNTGACRVECHANTRLSGLLRCTGMHKIDHNDRDHYPKCEVLWAVDAGEPSATGGAILEVLTAGDEIEIILTCVAWGGFECSARNTVVDIVYFKDGEVSPDADAWTAADPAEEDPALVEDAGGGCAGGGGNDSDDDDY